MLKSLKNWLNDRMGIDDLVTREFRTFPVPKDANYLSTLGFVALVAFIVQVISGIVLIMYYTPHPDHAFSSVQIITDQVSYGWLFRMMHVVGANLLVAVLFLHIIVVFYRGAYQKPREITWVSGALSFFLVMGFCITGALLPWNQLSYWSTTVITSIPTVIPGIGEGISSFLKGSATVSGATLNRFFAFHVAILPILIIVFAGLHLFFVHRIGYSLSMTDEPLPWKEFRHEVHANEKPFYPNFFTTQIGVSMLYIATMFFIIAFMPNLFFSADSHIVAAPLQTPLTINAPYYFRVFRKLLEIVPHEFTGVCVLILINTFFLFWPFFDLGEERKITKRPILMALFCFTFFMWLVLTIWGSN